MGNNNGQMWYNKPDDEPDQLELNPYEQGKWSIETENAKLEKKLYEKREQNKLLNSQIVQLQIKLEEAEKSNESLQSIVNSVPLIQTFVDSLNGMANMKEQLFALQSYLERSKSMYSIALPIDEIENDTDDDEDKIPFIKPETQI